MCIRNLLLRRFQSKNLFFVHILILTFELCKTSKTEKMYFLVLLKTIDNPKKAIIVPSKWIKSIDLSAVLNYGLRYQRNKIFKIYYSKDLFDEPDFNLHIVTRFDEQQCDCYNGTLVKHFGKFTNDILIFCSCTHFLEINLIVHRYIGGRFGAFGKILWCWHSRK